LIYFSCLSGSALLALLAATAPPWTVDSPAAAGHGARFGIGTGYLSERQESLRIESQQSAGVDGDADLLNRKFDLEWEVNGPVAQVPLALSCFRLTNLIRVFPTLTLEAGSVDVSLHSIAKTEPGSDATLSGAVLRLERSSARPPPSAAPVPGFPELPIAIAACRAST